MEKKKCSLKKHSEIDAIYYCQECKKYLCNKCESHHSELFETQHLYNLDKNIKDIFTGFCEEQNHNKQELVFFCKNHNKLCCLACLYNSDKKGYGQHKDCDTCEIENIKEEKKNSLKKNLDDLENLLDGLEKSIKEIKILFDKMNENKEELKLKIKNIFIKIRDTLNERENELLLEVDNKFNELLIKEELIRDIENFPNKVKLSLEKGKLIDKNWDDNNLNSVINDCINLENNMKEINLIKEKIENYNPINKIIIDFKPGINEDISPFLETIKKFGSVYDYINKQSNIIESYNDIEFIKTYLKTEENSKKLSLNLIYQATKDGQNSSDFHKKCDGISPLLIFIKTTKGLIFGGYTKEGFQSREKIVVDNKAFVFSISNKKIYKVKKDKNALHDYKTSGPSFIGSGWYNIYIPQKMLEDNSTTCPVGDSHYEGITKDYELNNGKKIFKNQEIEAYKILLN